MADSVGAAETIRISGGLIALIRELLLKIVVAYNAAYYEGRDFIFKGDGLIGLITFFLNDIEVRGLECRETTYSFYHKFKNGEWVKENMWNLIPSDEIKHLLKYFQEAVRSEFDGIVECDTSDDGLSWTVKILGEDGKKVLAIHDFDEIGAGGVHFHTCEKVEYRW